MRCLVRLGGFPLILGKKAQISLGHVGGGGKPAGGANFQLCCSWDCVWQGLLWLSRTHLHLLSFQGEKGKPAGPQMPSALSWWASAIKRVFSNCILSWVWCLPSFSLSNKKLAFLYNFYTKKLWDLVGFFFFHCTGRAAVSGQGRSVICSWILGPWSCVRPLCSLGRNSLPTWGAPQVLFPSTETFSASHDFYFAISFVPSQPHSLPDFLLVFKEREMQHCWHILGEGQMLGK